MTDHYTDEDVQAIQDAFDEWLHRMHGVTSSCRHEVEARAVLDAVAPAIAARALRALADEVGGVRTAPDGGPTMSLIGATTLRDRADEIEGR